MQNCTEKNSNRSFEWTYKMLCREENAKPLPAVQTYLQKNCLRFCADHVNLKDWQPILNGIMQDRSLSQISVYSRYCRKMFREKASADEKFVRLRRCARKGLQRPVLHTDFLLRSFVHSLAVCLRNSLVITSLSLDGIPLALKYIKILSDSLSNNRNLRTLSLARCRIGDAGCDLLLGNLQCNPSLGMLNLSSCSLTNRSAACLSLYLKKRRADLLQNIWQESTLLRDDVRKTSMKEGLQVLILDRNHKFGDIGLRQLIHVLKNDFWLKTLCLRRCGITKRGGEIALELLRTNSVIAQIELRENEVSAEVLQTIRKLLKRKKNKGERVPLGKRLLSHKDVPTYDKISKDASSQSVPKDEKSSKSQVHPQVKQRDCTPEIWCPTYTRNLKKKNSKIKKPHNAINKSNIKWANVDRLKRYLSVMIERNKNLITVLENSTDFLTVERNRRLSAEQAYHKIQPQLQNLRNKIIMQNSARSNVYCENTVCTNLRDVFDKLTISTNEKEFGTDGEF